jgi:ribosomal protein L29
MTDNELEKELQRLDRECVVLQRIIFEKEELIKELDKKKCALIELRHFRKMHQNQNKKGV